MTFRRMLLGSGPGPSTPYWPPWVAVAHDNTGALLDNRPFLFTSEDGLTWTAEGPAPLYTSDSYWLRDPSVVRYKGAWYLMLTDGDYDHLSGQPGRPAGPYQIARSIDLATWEPICNVPAPSGAFAGALFMDPDGLVHVLGSYGWASIYEQHPLTEDLLTWSDPVEIGHSAWQWTPNDPWIIFRDGHYWLFHGQGNGPGIACLVSDSPFTGYTQVTRGSSYGHAVGWDVGLTGSQYEAPCLVELPNGDVRIYFTNNHDFDAYSIRYSETSDLDLATATWTTPTILHDFDGYNHPLPFPRG